jgi:hypothetical protein
VSNIPGGGHLFFVGSYKKETNPPIALPIIPAFAHHESPEIPLASSPDWSDGCHDRERCGKENQ